MKDETVDRNKYMTIAEAASFLEVSRDWIDMRVKRGLFTTMRRGHWTYITRESAKAMKEKM